MNQSSLCAINVAIMIIIIENLAIIEKINNGICEQEHGYLMFLVFLFSSSFAGSCLIACEHEISMKYILMANIRGEKNRFVWVRRTSFLAPPIQTYKTIITSRSTVLIWLCCIAIFHPAITLFQWIFCFVCDVHVYFLFVPAASSYDKLYAILV